MPSSDTQFKKGQSGNPQGRPRLSSKEHSYRKLLNYEILEAFYRYSHKTGHELDAMAKDPSLLSKERLLIMLLRDSIENPKYVLKFIKSAVGIR